MGFFGGALGGILGGWLAGPWGAVLGAVIGYNINGGTDNSSASHSEILSHLFAAMGRLCKSDGTVSQSEADFVSALIKEFGKNDAEKRKLFKRAFNEGKNADFIAEISILKRFAPAERRAVMEILCALARVDGKITAGEKELLQSAEKCLGLYGFCDAFFNSGSTGGQRYEESRSTASDELREAYRTLGCSPEDTDAAIKKAWHKKTKEFHPDLIAGKGLSEDFIEFADSQMKKINLAYETIMKSRS